MGVVFSKDDCNFEIKKILIFSGDNRELKFIDYHNNNLEKYCKKYGYTYKFHKENYKNVPVYWSKLLYCKEYLDSNKYEYVMWMDTDANILNDDIGISEILCKYNSDNKFHIFIGTDFASTTYNAGIFIIKNSHIGRKFINQCIYELKTECIKNNKFVLGEQWAGICYEQGRMNKLINNEYFEHTFQLPSFIFKNTPFCDKSNSFILHKFGNKFDIDFCFKN